MSFLRRLVLSYSLVFVTIVVLLMGLAYRYMLAVGEQTAHANQLQLATKVAEQVATYLGELDKMALQVKSDTRIINLFSQLQEESHEGNYFEQDVMASIDVGSILTSHNGPGMPIWRISVYDQHGDFICAGASVTPQSHVTDVLEPVQTRNLMHRLISDRPGYEVRPPERDRWSGTYTARYTSLLRPITDYYSKEVYGIVEVQQSVEKLEARIALNVLENMQVFLFDHHGIQIFPNDSRFEDLDQSQYAINTRRVPDYDWQVTLVQSRASMMAPYRPLLLYLFLGGVVLFVVLVVGVYFISRRISAPIVSLSKKVREVSASGLSAPIPTEDGSDEVRELSSAFTAMFKRLDDSVACEKKAYMLALQSQMDPHFLYNSLSLISGMGMETGSDKIVDTCEKVSAIMRYASSYDSRITTLGDEIENVSNYLDLMQLRYERHFSFGIAVDPRLKDIELPRMVLQPIVENCFEHGFKPVSPPWRVDIKAACDEYRWTVTISDNGAGFDEARLAELHSKVEQYSLDLPANYKEMKIGGLGLINTIIRLRFSASSRVDCTITGNAPNGTVVVLEGEMP